MPPLTLPLKRVQLLRAFQAACFALSAGHPVHVVSTPNGKGSRCCELMTDLTLSGSWSHHHRRPAGRLRAPGRRALPVPFVHAAGLGQRRLERPGPALGDEPAHWPQLIVASAVTGAVAWLRIHHFLRWVERVGLMPFVACRLALGVARLALRRAAERHRFAALEPAARLTHWRRPGAGGVPESVARWRGGPGASQTRHGRTLRDGAGLCGVRRDRPRRRGRARLERLGPSCPDQAPRTTGQCRRRASSRRLCGSGAAPGPARRRTKAPPALRRGRACATGTGRAP